VSGAPLSIDFAEVEGRHLLAIVDEYVALLDGPRDARDAGVNRLAPDPYPDDRDAADEYRISTREDLLDARLAEALSVRTALEGFERPVGEDLMTRTIDISPTDLDPWLRTLSGIRLVLASRLGIGEHDVHDAEDPRFGTYDWLGYRLELLVQLADRHDA
jgi:hypothetical protein